MKQYSLFAVLSVSMIVFAMAFVKKGNEHPDKHLEIVLRNIGHQVSTCPGIQGSTSAE